MSMEYIRQTYGVPAKRGRQIRFTNINGRALVGPIVAARGQYLRVRLGSSVRTLHPTWQVEYLHEDGSVLWPAGDSPRIAPASTRNDGASLKCSTSERPDKEQ